MILKNINREGLITYLESQLKHFFPDARPVRTQINGHIDEALERLNHCINAVRLWDKNTFNYLHSSQYTQFIYYLSNSIWRQEGNESDVCTKLFYLNKALNGIDCFYEIELPDIFFIGHSVGIVLAKATYGNYFAIYQNSTVGKNHGIAPVIGDGVVMYPNTAIIGRCNVGGGTVLSHGTGVINCDTPKNCLAFQGAKGELIFREPKKNIIMDIFRDCSVSG